MNRFFRLKEDSVYKKGTLVVARGRLSPFDGYITVNHASTDRVISYWEIDIHSRYLEPIHNKRLIREQMKQQYGKGCNNIAFEF